jgi:hypothetical protein
MTRALALYFLLLTLSACAEPVAADPPPLRWDESESSVALVRGQNVLWKFNYDSELNVPYFHPVSTDSGRVLTWDRPPDHAWHHGLWFCWKYINGVNYWEHDRQTGKPAGRTRITDVRVETRNDHSARISLTLDYHPAGEDQVVLSERRRIDITAPNSQGEYHLDWTADFTAGQREVVLDRTPPKAQSWGGYAGLSVRFAKELSDRQVTSDTGPVEFGPGDRHRSKATSMDYSGIVDGDPVGLAFLDHPDNPRHPTPWYVIRSSVMGYINAALLNDEPMTLEPGQRLMLRYRLIVHPHRWDAERLQDAQASFSRSDFPNER